MPKIFEINESNFESIVFGKLRKMDDSKYFVSINYIENEKKNL